MTDLLFFPIDADTSIAVEIDSDEPGFEEAAPSPWISPEHFSGAVARGRRAAEEVLKQFRDMTVRPAEIEIEFGLKFAAEAGVVLAKTATEAHLAVKLIWRGTTE